MSTLFKRVPLVGHGIDQAGTWANRPLNAGNGFKWWADDKQRGFTYDSRRKLWWPDDGLTFYDAATNYLVDHFAGGTIDDGYSLGATTGATAPAVDAGAQGGIITGVTSADDDDATSLTRALVFVPEDGLIRVGARFKIDDITTVAFCVGLTDVLATGTTTEMPFELDTVTYTSNAADAAAFLFDTDATDDTIRCCAVDTNVDGTHVDTEIEPVNATYLEFLIELTAAGVATFYINETLAGTIAATAVTLDVALTPVLIAEARADADRNWHADYLFCHQDG